MAMWGAIIGGAMNMMSDGDSQTTTNSIPPEWSGLASMTGNFGQGFADLPFTPYPYARTADLNPYQYAGYDMTANRALGGSQLPQQAEDVLSNTLGGGYMTGPGLNPFLGATSNAGLNPYSGKNPFLENAIGSGLEDISNQFNRTVAPTMAATALRSGSFGNSGMQEAELAARSQLAKDMGRFEQGMRFGDYTTQQNLAESGLNRSLQSQLADLSRNAQLGESGLNRSTSMWDAERNRMMSALGLSPNIYSLGYQPSQMLQGIGGIMQQQGQNVLNNAYDQFQQAQDWPFKIFNTMRAPFGGIPVGGSQTTTGPAANPVAGMLGGAMMGRQLFPNGFGTTPNQNIWAPGFDSFSGGSGWTGGH